MAERDSLYSLGVALASLVVLYLIGRENYLLFHSLAEMLSVVVSFRIL